MPPKKKSRTTRAKPKIVTLTPEEQEARDQVDLFLKDFDKNVEMTIKEAWRDVETISASINTLYKLELLKLPQEVKNMKWDDYYKQSLDKGKNPLALSEAVSTILEDSICANVDTQVSQLKSAIKTTTKKKGGGRKRAASNNKDVSSATRSSSNNRTASGNSVSTETPATSSRRKRGATAMTTPANTRAPPNMGRTPMITPKFDTTNLSRTVSRVARANEVLVSLSGSPVTVSSRAAAKSDEAVLVSLGKGEALNVPLGEDTDPNLEHLDQEQINKLEEIQRSLANMLKARREAESVSGEEVS